MALVRLPPERLNSVCNDKFMKRFTQYAYPFVRYCFRRHSGRDGACGQTER